MKRITLAALALLTSSIVTAQVNYPLPKQPVFKEVDGTFPADGKLYDPPSVTDPVPAYAYQLPPTPSNFQIRSELASTTDGLGNPNAPDKKARFTCGGPAVFLFADPVLAFNRPNWGHLHQFFGNGSPSYDSTYFSLRTKGDGFCGGGMLNRSAYWIPAMMDGSKNQAVASYGQVAYYTKELEGNIAYPRGFRFIGGYNLSDRNRTKINRETGSAWTKSGESVGWQCIRDDGGPTVSGGGSFLNADGSDRLNNCIGTLTAEINFPDCWDRIHLQAGDGRAHTRHSQGPVSNGGMSNRRCPPKYSPIAQFQIKASWKVNGYAEYKHWFVASDRMPGMIEPSGTTMHADWFGAWDPLIFDIWQSQCSGAFTQRFGVGRPADCNFSSFGNGWRGKVNEINPRTGFKTVRDDLYLGNDKYRPIPGQYMPGFPGIAKGTNIAELMAGHSLKAGGQHTVH
ncbi:DUF1996 domain-containing protein [Sphingomonas rubra]|uniref:DUF1996 domain-containing protein n=1 Tax=Sphingomonas rubra TaxID=634430 RepID=A0A1I5UTL8_9SPHN|nr:DUF1996 domain-containing protein [Sphingomonas rubra]SFP98552.1 protein of unknown function [Sphingomonas rubra]